MKPRTVVTGLLLAFVVASIVYLVIGETRAPREPADHTTSIDGGAAKVIVFYFHGTKRCNTCRTIETYTKEAVENGFPEELGRGDLEWRVVNVDEPENEHFVEDYQLATRSVVLVKVENGAQQNWVNLEEVWELVQDKDAFISYIHNNTNAFLAGRDG